MTAAAAPQVPSAEEIEALLAGRKQTTIVFFLDETFEELEFDATATVLEAVEFLARVIKLEHFTTFTLYECRKARAAAAALTLPLPRGSWQARTWQTAARSPCAARAWRVASARCPGKPRASDCMGCTLPRCAPHAASIMRGLDSLSWRLRARGFRAGCGL